MNISAKVRKEAGNALHRVMEPTYFSHIPLLTIQEALKSCNIMMCDESGDPWEGLLCGKEARVLFSLASTNGGDHIENTFLCLSWYKMPSGSYEVIGYLT